MGKKKERDQKFKKILLMGLDNAGKTSLYLILSKNANLLAYYSLRPTKGLDIKTLNDGNDEFSIWDFGGQKEFRQQYLVDMNNYLKDVNKIIYVIDVQDTSRYDEALSYLQDIVDNTRKRNLIIPFSIFLHKFDKGLEKDVKFSEDTIKVNLIDKLAQILTGFYFDVFKTTILTLFQKTKLL